MNERLQTKGIRTIVGDKFGTVFLEYKGKRIKRPYVQDTPLKVKKHFNIDI